MVERRGGRRRGAGRPAGARNTGLQRRNDERERVVGALHSPVVDDLLHAARGGDVDSARALVDLIRHGLKLGVFCRHDEAGDAIARLAALIAAPADLLSDKGGS